MSYTQWKTALLLSCVAFAVARAQSPSGGTPSAKTVLSEGEVTGRDVYIRSGSSLNHYEVSKMQLGDHVSIVGHEGDWYEILPPDGSFSLVSGEYVDTTDHQTGAINGNNVRVRAGSSLNANKYTVQAMLSKGTEVTILGTNPDGFLRIKPPPGATLWVNKQFVKPLTPIAGDTRPTSARSTGDAASRDAVPPGKDEIVNADLASVSKSADVKSGGEGSVFSGPKKSAIPDVQQHPDRKSLADLDDASREELKKPVSERDWGPLMGRYQTIADRADDEVSRVYAKHRIEQLADLKSITDSIREFKSLGDSSDEVRRQYLQERNLLPPATPLDRPAGVDAQGELRVSALYPPGSTPRRFRLVDTTTPTPRTVGYVEVPPGSDLGIDAFIGRYIGIRASEKRLQPGGVNPVPIFVLSEIVPLQPPTPAPDSPANEKGSHSIQISETVTRGT